MNQPKKNKYPTQVSWLQANHCRRKSFLTWPSLVFNILIFLDSLVRVGEDLSEKENFREDTFEVISELSGWENQKIVTFTLSVLDPSCQWSGICKNVKVLCHCHATSFKLFQDKDIIVLIPDMFRPWQWNLGFPTLGFDTKDQGGFC